MKLIENIRIPNSNEENMPIEFNDDNLSSGFITFKINDTNYCMDINRFILIGNVFGSLRQGPK